MRTIEQRLDKASKTLSNQARRATNLSSRSLTLVDRYNDLREEASQANIWDAWCKTKGLCPTHDGMDYFA